MVRRSVVLALVLLALLPLGAPARAASSPRDLEPAQLDVAALGPKIERAERLVDRWYRRTERWYARIDRWTMRVERLLAIVDATDPPVVGEIRRPVPRTIDPGFRLLRAQRTLRTVLSGSRARHVRAELDTWTAYLAELVRARERASQPEPEAVHPTGGDGAGGLPTGPLTYESWAGAFLSHLGAPTCSENLLIVVTWETAESTSAAFNPLATTRDMPGATDMNSVGVKDFVSLRQGLDASRDTLLLGASSYGYGAIVDSLRRCGSAEVTARAINASAWCRGCVGGAYITGLLPLVRASYAEHAARAISRG